MRENKLESGYIRPMCFYGAEGMGLRADNLKVHVIVAAWTWGSYMGEDGMKNGIRVRTSSLNAPPRQHHHVPCQGQRQLHELDAGAARGAALPAATRRMLLDTEGYVSEGSGENIFIVRDGVMYTPDLTSALDGITRATIMQLAAELGIQVVEKRITRDEVYIADEAFFTGTAAEVTPIREVDGRAIGTGKRGPITEKLQTLYFDVVHGRSHQHVEWLTPVA